MYACSRLSLRCIPGCAHHLGIRLAPRRTPANAWHLGTRLPTPIISVYAWHLGISLLSVVNRPRFGYYLLVRRGSARQALGDKRTPR